MGDLRMAKADAATYIVSLTRKPDELDGPTAAPGAPFTVIVSITATGDERIDSLAALRAAAKLALADPKSVGHYTATVTRAT